MENDNMENRNSEYNSFSSWINNLFDINKFKK